MKSWPPRPRSTSPWSTPLVVSFSTRFCAMAID
ncbi:hypothetical protein Patl1_36979 [Pistacia atlantica]|nr:hypothetical protein Patl1_36979 [Pistacia atlantica]